MLPLEWIEARIPIGPTKKDRDDDDGGDEVERILPSFAELQQKTRTTLYGNDNNGNHNLTGIHSDKSPKGSVDEPVQHLVDLINHHSAITTLSSCSGRISLFDPNQKSHSHQQQQQQQQQEEEKEVVEKNPSSFTENSGKGRGGWLVVSHDILDPQEIVDAIFKVTPIENEEKVNLTTTKVVEPWILKFEPMLLHIAARSLVVGQALLQVALGCGFRESGLVVTTKRVTVAIRSHSLSLSLPILPPHHHHGNLCPSKEYIIAVIHDCNRRLKENWNHLQRLYTAIEAGWFTVSLRPKIRIRSMIPTLRLWNTAIIAYPDPIVEGEDACISIYAFGGYGMGPNPNVTTSKRSGEIYQLRFKNGNNPLGDWKTIVLEPPDASSTDTCWEDLKDIEPLSRLPSPCQGMTAARIRDWIILWGGRESPTKPLDDLFLFHPPTKNLAKFKKENIQGDIWPGGRWGHSLIPISNDRLVLVGGGNGTGDEEKNNLKDIYILHYIPERGGFLWERVSNVTLPVGLCYAGASVLPQSDTLLVRGGLSSEIAKNNILHLFDKSPSTPGGPGMWMCRFGKSTMTGTEEGEEIVRTEAFIMEDSSPNTSSSLSSSSNVFGASLSTLMNGKLVVQTGGTSTSSTATPLQICLVQEEASRNKVKLMDLPISSVESISAEATTSTGTSSTVLDFGCLVHHTNVTISESIFAVIGGGVTSFAFGDSFAASYLLELVVVADTPKEMNGVATRRDDGQIRKKDDEDDMTKSERTVVLPNSTPNRHVAPPKSTRVIYVPPQDAKLMKTRLEELGWLDKGFRMIPVILGDNDDDDDRKKDMTENDAGINDGDSVRRIAIPIKSTITPEQLDNEWSMTSSKSDESIPSVSWGVREDLPLSTARFARAGSKKSSL